MADDSLERAVKELCIELISSKSPSDAEAILSAAAALVASSRAAQTCFGRVLVARHSTQTTKQQSATQLQLLVERYLYDVKSSLATLQLLAVLAHDHVVNQRRIARHVFGVCISSSCKRLSHPHAPEPLLLLAVSLPAPLRGQYKQWRSRRQQLHGRRVPIGSPPTRDGVPAPCFCDDCLGCPQHLTTWIDHYHDLSRWSQDTPSLPERPHLDGDAFLQRVLDTDYTLASCPWTAISGSAVNTTQHQSREGVAVAYYFVPAQEPIEERSDEHGPNPLRHVCGIEIDSSIAPFVSARRDRDRAARTSRNEHQVDSIASDDEPVDRVVLFQRQVTFRYCRALHDNHKSEDTTIAQSSEKAARFVEDLRRSEGDLSTLTAGQLEHHLRTNHELEGVEARILYGVLQFLEPHVLISHETLKTILLLVSIQEPRTHDNPKPREDLKSVCEEEQEICELRVVAILADHTLEIVAHGSGGIKYSHSFRPSKLMQDSHLWEFFPRALALEDESLGDMLNFCRLCRHNADTCTNSNKWICLAPVVPTNTRVVAASQHPQQNKANDHKLADLSAPLKLLKPNAHGLSRSAELSLHVLGQNLATHSRVKVADVAQHLRRLIGDCNDRMLALANDRELTPSVREAARERCRVCRDLLVQAGKRMKLGHRDQGADSLSDEAARRLQRELGRALQVSESSDAWEVRDLRVDELHLSRHVWANGVPDPEFYVNRDARSRANRAAQRSLNQRLVGRARK